MILILLLILLTVAAAFLWRLARAQSAPVRDVCELMSRSKPVDLQSFRNLTDPREEEFLHSSLSGREFRRLTRMRMLAATEYVWRTAHNAKLMLQFADAARRSSDITVSKLGVELAESALQLRIYSVLAACFFYLRFVFPFLPARVSDFASRYELLCDRVAGLTRIQLPTAVSEVIAAL
jgi:hypothetical protein